MGLFGYRKPKFRDEKIQKPSLLDAISKDIEKLPDNPPSVEKRESEWLRKNPVRPSPLKQELIIPPTVMGMELAYHYKDVQIKCDGTVDPKYLGDMFDLIPEPEQGDERAVAAYMHGNKVGYMYPTNLRDMVLDYGKKNQVVRAYLTHIGNDAGDIKIFLAFYKPRRTALDDRRKECRKSKRIKLNGTSNDDVQFAIMECNVGDIVEIEYDFDKGKYMAICGGPIGYFHKSMNEFLEENDDAEVFISDIADDDDGNTIVRVEIFT